MNKTLFPDYTKLDQKIFGIAGTIETNLIKSINPTNAEKERTKFFQALEKKEHYNPKYEYSTKNPLYTYFALNPKLNTHKNELIEMLKEIQRDELGVIFESKILDLLDKIEIIKSIGTENFAGNTESYYGNTDKETTKTAKEIIQKKVTEEEKSIPLEKVVPIIKEFLKKKKLDYKITIREPAGAKFAVNEATKEILINKDTVFSKKMIERLLAHEIETHLYRYENGLIQPYKILAYGFSRETTETEEGLAANIEKLKGISSEEQIKDYAGRVIAINTAQKKSFYETFEEMNKYFGKEDAFRLTLRAKRGIAEQKQKGAFTKDMLYLKGMLKVAKFLEKNKLEKLYCGKYAIEDIPLIRDIPGIKEPKYLPEIKGL
jgi:uncharacterized protein (TIGR02421 family)